jgi:hypothetical protein
MRERETDAIVQRIGYTVNAGSFNAESRLPSRRQEGEFVSG